MKAHLKIKVLFVFAIGILSFQGNAHATKLGVLGDYPVATGVQAQNFSSTLGASIDFYLDPILDPKIDNFLSLGYRSLTIRADGESSYRMLPILIGLELPGRVSDEVKITFAGAVGGTVTYINVPNAQSMKYTGYFTAQLKPGIEWDASKDFAFRAELPITYLIASKPFSFLTYSFGLQYTFGQGDGK